jgi:hypothetical protein
VDERGELVNPPLIVNLLKSQQKIRKIVAIVFYRFVYGFNPKHMLDRFDVGASIIEKYAKYNLWCSL